MSTNRPLGPGHIGQWSRFRFLCYKKGKKEKEIKKDWPTPCLQLLHVISSINLSTFSGYFTGHGLISGFSRSINNDFSLFCISKKSTEVSMTVEISIKLAIYTKQSGCYPSQDLWRSVWFIPHGLCQFSHSHRNLEYTLTSRSCYFHFSNGTSCVSHWPLSSIPLPARHLSQRDRHWRTYLPSRVQQRRWRHSTS